MMYSTRKRIIKTCLIKDLRMYMTSRLSEIFEDEELVEKVKKRLPSLFQSRKFESEINKEWIIFFIILWNEFKTFGKIPTIFSLPK